MSPLFFAAAFLIIGSMATGSEEPLRYSMFEEKPAGTVVGNVKTDAHLQRKFSDAELSTMNFTIVNKNQTHFAIDRSGTIRTAAILDRDKICPKKETCPLEMDVLVYLSRSPKHIIKVFVEILDLNDNAPIFPGTYITEIISESTAPGRLFSIQSASDPDSPRNGNPKYELDSTHRGLFSLQQDDSIEDGYFELFLVLNGTLDRETQGFYQIKVIASDSGHPPKSGSVLIHLEVEDDNDNSPVFGNSSYVVEIGENFIPSGGSLLTVRARDPDAGSNARSYIPSQIGPENGSRTISPSIRHRERCLCCGHSITRPLPRRRWR